MSVWENMTSAERKHAKIRATAFKTAALETLGFDDMREELDQIQSFCDEMRYHYNGDGLEMLLDAMEGDEDEAHEFKMLFCDVSGKCEELIECIYEIDRELYDAAAVALFGDRYRSYGYDSYSDDYFKLTSFDIELATTHAGKKIMKLTKETMLSQLAQTWGVILSFQSLKLQYDSLKTIYDLIRGENQSILKQLDEIDKLYEEAEADGFKEWAESTKNYEKALLALPDRCWIE